MSLPVDTHAVQHFAHMPFHAEAYQPEARQRLQRLIRMQLMALGLLEIGDLEGTEDESVTNSFLANYRQKSRLLKDYRSPVDQRIEAFLAKLCKQAGINAQLRVPTGTFVLSTPGLAREISLPPDRDVFETDLLKSYRVRNGVLHNPKADRRTTAGTFHVADIGLPVPDDKIAVPFAAYVEMFKQALNPPHDTLLLPFTATSSQPAHLFCSLLLRPMVCPEVPGVSTKKSMEVRFFAPGTLVSNLDFVENIFGNAGDPVLYENDAALDVEHWTGHTGCVILAPHLTRITKKSVGLPHYDKATERQRRDRQCWKKEDELYNDGTAFKLTCRSADGVVVTLIADNYYGYCKKEVKTQISFSANLFGNCEEEHAGGAVAFQSFSLGVEFRPSSSTNASQDLAAIAKANPQVMALQPQGHAVDRRLPSLLYIPADASLNINTGLIEWQRDGQQRSIPLKADRIYMTTNGIRYFLSKHPGTGRFRLVQTTPDGVFCHKPCTVSGGGKSEISKSLLDYMIYGPIYISDIKRDLDQVEAIFNKDHSVRWKKGKEPQDYSKTPSRPVLGSKRSLGSVIKLLTPSPDYTDEYNKWLASIPSEIMSLVFLIKRLYKPEWGQDWRKHVTVDIVNGEPGHELKVDDRKAGGSYLRVGLLPDGNWRTFKVRQDFYPAAKIQTEDDITASAVLPTQLVSDLAYNVPGPSTKIAANCEARLFQRPDDAIHPGLDKQTEQDMAKAGNFISNFEPLNGPQIHAIVDNISEYDAFSEPMKKFLGQAAAEEEDRGEWGGVGLTVCSARPRLVDGKPTKNPRYLQDRPDLARPHERYICEMGMRLARGLRLDAPVTWPVHSVLVGRRSNPPEKDVRSLAVYNPIHYQELPELFMDFICSLTGKSPSTTGAGSEGALTKGPFNALLPTADLNNALVSYILTGLAGFSTAAGYVGPNIKVGHDISLLVPEIWCRFTPQERDPQWLIANGYLEPVKDFDYQGQKILASRLGYRITYQFVRTFFGRIFDSPARVFDDAMLRPETQGMETYVDGILNIMEAQKGVAQAYFADGAVEQACPPIKALLHIMAHGHYEGRDAHHPDIRKMFTREYLLASDWYKERLKVKQKRDVALWQRHVSTLKEFASHEVEEALLHRLDIPRRTALATQMLDRVASPAYLDMLIGTLGADPLGGV